MSYENSDRHRVAWSREKKEANNIYEGNEGYFACRRFFTLAGSFILRSFLY